MCRFSVFVKKLFLFAVIFMLLTGNTCFSEEVTLTKTMPDEIRIVRDTVESGSLVLVGKNGFTVVQNVGRYTITFDGAFPVAPTVVCTYQEQPGTDFFPKAQLISVSTTGAVVDIVDLDGTAPYPGGSFTFMAVGSR